MTLKLISYQLCPYVHKAATTLRVKHIPYEIEYIQLSKPPQWFHEISPLGKVPLLLVEDHVLFESTAIIEYLDEAYPPRLHPADVIQRAKHRAWMAFSDTCLRDYYRCVFAKNEADFHKALARLHDHFDQLEQGLTAGPFFAGMHFSLVDASFAPLLYHLKLLAEVWPGIFDPQRHPRIVHWKDTLIVHRAVRQAVVDDFAERYFDWLSNKDSFLGRLAIEHASYE